MPSEVCAVNFARELLSRPRSEKFDNKKCWCMIRKVGDHVPIAKFDRKTPTPIASSSVEEDILKATDDILL